jgi:hypothetical protein
MSNEAETIKVWVGARCVLMHYRRYSDGASSLNSLPEPPVETRSSENESQPKGIERRGRLEGWNFPERRKA